MSKKIGLMLLLAGVAVLGFWGTWHQGPRMEAQVRAGASTIAPQAKHDVSITVSGRDITLTGLADTDTEAASLTALANQIVGRRVVRSDLTVLPIAAPYLTTITKAADGSFAASGAISTESLRADLLDTTDALNALTLSSGAPKDYDTALTNGLTALASLDEGTLTVSDTAVSLSGLAPDQTTLDSASAALAALPAPIVVTDTVRYIPVATPYTLDATKDASGSIQLSGYTPSDQDRDALAQATGVDTSQLVVARGAPEGWAASTRAGLAALGKLTDGTLSLKDTNLRITGTALDDTTLAALNNDLEGLEGVTTDQTIAITPKDVATDLTVRFDRIRGLFVAGTAPTDLAAADVAKRLKATAIQGDFNMIGTAAAAPVQAGLDALSPLLSEFEQVTLTAQNDTVTVNGAVLAEADLDQITTRLLESAAFDAVTLNTTTNLSADGDQRLNPLTGASESYRGGFWVPDVMVDAASAESCGALTSAVLESDSVKFVTASADLDAGSRATIAQLSGIVNSCLSQNPKLSILIEGHTDSVGNSIDNLRLSAARAAAVRQALVARGATAVRMRTQGLGEEYPIADNGTEEGRAQNRRTVVAWSE